MKGYSMWQLTASKDGVVKYCTNRHVMEYPEPRVELAWKSASDANCIPQMFPSERYAWWCWYTARKANPEAYAGWWGEVTEVLR